MKKQLASKSCKYVSKSKDSTKAVKKLATKVDNQMKILGKYVLKNGGVREDEYEKMAS